MLQKNEIDFIKELVKSEEVRINEGVYKITLTDEVLRDLNEHIRIIKELKKIAKDIKEEEDVTTGKVYLTFETLPSYF